MAPHSSTLAWKIPWREEPGGLQSMGSLRVGHDGVTSLSLFTFMHWRRKWQPTPLFLPGESQGQRSLVGCCLWGRTESDTTEATAAAGSKVALCSRGRHYLILKVAWCTHSSQKRLTWRVVRALQSSHMLSKTQGSTGDQWRSVLRSIRTC